MTDDFSSRYAGLLTGSYDCVDRIVLKAVFPLGHSPGGFRYWWRNWHDGTDDTLDNTHLIRMASRFARRVKAPGQPGSARPAAPARWQHSAPPRAVAGRSPSARTRPGWPQPGSARQTRPGRPAIRQPGPRSNARSATLCAGVTAGGVPGSGVSSAQSFLSTPIFGPPCLAARPSL